MNATGHRVAIVGGGTAGHVYPALAVAEAYRAIVPEAEITFLGTGLGFEGRIIPATGCRLETIPGSPLFGTDVVGKLRALKNAVGGMTASTRIFRRERIEGLLSFGGYASAGPVLAARRARLPIALCEPNVIPGLSNRMLARLADQIYLGSSEAASAFRRGASVVTGVPVRSSISAPARAGRSIGEPFRILVLGGSLGSSFLNRMTPALIAAMLGRGLRLEVRHQTGAPHDDEVRSAYRRAGVAATVTAFVAEIAPLYAWADLAITCAGAITLAELAVVALPALVVPLATASEDHQAANARAFHEASGCPWVRESEWETGRLAAELQRLLEGEDTLRRLQQRLKAIAVPTAAEIVARAWKNLMLSGH
jgi:UDP-N-acetylglucosamine--N-acetylmuramyl-(pentapeptide) pyrophosphoryl-undecaprenol N-acetylglucosamine transferase